MQNSVMKPVVAYLVDNCVLSCMVFTEESPILLLGGSTGSIRILRYVRNSQGRTPITLFRSIRMFNGTGSIFLTFSLNDGVLCRMLSVPLNILMDLNNVMPTPTLEQLVSIVWAYNKRFQLHTHLRPLEGMVNCLIPISSCVKIGVQMWWLQEVIEVEIPRHF